MRPWTTLFAAGAAAMLSVSCRSSPPSPVVARADGAWARDAPAADTATTLPDGSAFAPAEDAPLVHVTAFDCAKVTGFPDEQLDGGIADGEGLSDWKNGGPAGAVWNAFDLHCVADVRVSCAAGAVRTELRVGRSLVAAARHMLNGGSSIRWSTVVPEAQWERNLDDRAPTRDYYRTGIFRLTALLSCEESELVAPGLAWHPWVVAERSFTAGFASGE